MNRKIIIITRNTDSNYSDNNNPLGKMIVEGKGVPISKKESYLAAYLDLSKYKTTTGNNETIYLTAGIASDYDVENIDDAWLDGKNKDLRIPNDIVELLDKVRETLDDKMLYEKI